MTTEEKKSADAQEHTIEKSSDIEIAYNPEAKKEPYWKAMLAVITSGCAFMSDGYQQGIMTPINLILLKSYPDYTSNYKTMVTNSNLVANIIGQLFFGVFIDRIGRKQGFTLTTTFIVIGSILAACAKGHPDSKIFWWLIIARGISGVGIGGEYPTSASSAMEAAEERLTPSQKLVPFILSTNFPISLGLPVATCIFLIFQAIWGEERYNPIWRSCFGFGALFPFSIYFLRLRLNHSKMYTQNAIKKKTPYKLILKKYWKDLFAVSLVWFLMDFVIYPNNLFSSSVISMVIPNAGVKKTAEWLLLLGFFATLGSILGMILLPYFTRRQLFTLGFLLYGIVSIIVGAAFEKISNIHALFIVLYALMNLFIYAGPANLQSVISSETFATCIRGSAYGFSACIGKTGAAVGTEVFTPLQTKYGVRSTFLLSGAMSLFGAIIAWTILPDTDKYNLPEKDAEFNQFLMDNGWSGELGENNGKHELGEIEVLARTGSSL